MASDDKPPCRQHLLATDTAQLEQPAEEYVFPTWWLYVQASFMAAPAISNSLILPLLIPPRVKQLVGEQRKAAALGAITSFQTMIQLTAPVLGALSDKLQTPCGRRRPFIIVGQLSILAGIWCIWHSTSYILLNAAYQLYFVGCLLAWVPWMSILPDIVAEVQRGQAAAIQSLVIGATGVLGYTMGVLRGESILSLALCYIICFVLHALMIPIGWMSVAARPGYCALEKQRAEPPAATAAVAAASTVTNPGVCAALRDFVSPFWESPSFFWLFLNIMFFGIGNIFVSQWIFYWYTDIIGCAHCEGFKLFGHTVAHSTQTAAALLGVLTNVLGTVAAVPGGRLGDKLGRKPVVFGCIALYTLTPLCLAALSTSEHLLMRYGISDFSVVVLVIVAQGSINGVSAPNSQALQADCLPRAADGTTAKNGSRDMLLISLGANIPCMILPTPMGHVLDILNGCQTYGATPGSGSASIDLDDDDTLETSGSAAAGAAACDGHHRGYEVFFLIGASFYALSLLPLCKVSLQPRQAVVEPPESVTDVNRVDRSLQ
jgi:MFS family permease